MGYKAAYYLAEHYYLDEEVKRVNGVMGIKKNISDLMEDWIELSTKERLKKDKLIDD